MNDIEFKKRIKIAACTVNPIEHLIPEDKRYEIVRQIKQESLDIYGEDLLAECSKRRVCFKKECMGRPLPFKSLTALPYLQKLRETQKIVNDEMFITTKCTDCPIFKTCKSTCEQINDFIDRDKIKEPTIYYKDLKDNVMQEPEVNLEFVFGADLVIPWDCLNETRQNVVKKYLYEQRDFKYVADTLDLNNQARTKYEFYAALTTLSEYAMMRKFIKENGALVYERTLQILKDVYVQNKSITDVAKEHQVTKQSIQQLISRVVKKHKIKWNTFVKKQGKTLIYNIPEIMK